MQISKRRINQNLESEVFYTLYQLLADLKTSQEVKTFLEDILGKSELTVMAKRLAIAHYLDRNRSYQNIKDNLKVSSATIATVDKLRKSEGFQLALKRIEAERWASEWSGKIEKLFGKK